MKLYRLAAAKFEQKTVSVFTKGENQFPCAFFAKPHLYIIEY